jgi:hypothetical protein
MSDRCRLLLDSACRALLPGTAVPGLHMSRLSRLKLASRIPYTAALWLKHLEMFSCDPREIPPSAV